MEKVANPHKLDSVTVEKLAAQNVKGAITKTKLIITDN